MRPGASGAGPEARKMKPSVATRDRPSKSLKSAEPEKLLKRIAAFFWFASAMVRLPQRITVGFGGAGGTAQELGEAVRRQSRWSACGAIAAAIAAGAQAVSMALSQQGFSFSGSD